MKAVKRWCLRTAVLLCLSGASLAKAGLPPGAVEVWGDNSYGQTNVPPGLTNLLAIASDDGSGLALQGNGALVAWGHNNYSQTNVPLALSNVVAIAGGGVHSVALQSNGTVVAWGNNGYGQTNVPTGLSNVVAIAAGYYHSMALQSNGTVTAWGDNYYGEINVPHGLSNVVAIAGGFGDSLALSNDGNVVAWGNNDYGEVTVPPGLSSVMAIAAGGYHNLALLSNGTVVAWGDNAYGEATVPTGLTNVAAIAAGLYHSLALLSNGTVVAWGENTSGQATVPSGLSNVVAIAAGGNDSTVVSTLFVALGPAFSLAPQTGTNLSAAVLSEVPFACQWSFDGTPIPGAIGTNLAITNFSLANAGAYSISVTNPFGSATASTVLALVNSPVILVDGVDVGGGMCTRVDSSQITINGAGPNTNVYYTLDGSEPDFSGIPYSGRFTLTNSATVRAIGYNQPYTNWVESAPIYVQILRTYPLTAATPGGGSLSLSPAPYEAGTRYLSNTVVTLTATPSNGWAFVNWSGDSTLTTNVVTFRMNTPHSVQAVFGAPMSLFTNGNGQILLNPTNGPYPYGSTLQLTAFPNAGSYFFGWAGAATGSADPLTYTVTNVPEFTGLFGELETNQVALTLLVNSGGTVIENPRKNPYNLGDTVTLTASPSNNFVFSAWSGAVSGKQNPLVLTLNTSEVVSASFVVGTVSNPPVVESYPVLVSFHATNGLYPNGLIQGTDGRLYGTAQGGTVFEMTTNGVLATLSTLSGQPESSLVQRQYDGNLYGTTADTAFIVTTNGGATNLTTFPMYTNSPFPSGLVEGRDGNFYGTTRYGTNGAATFGTIFQMTFNGRVTILYMFSGNDDGAYPEAALVQAVDGNFYGTTTEGGTNNAGTVFRINAAGALTSLYSFTGGDDGYFPSGALVQGADGNLYGTTQYGGTNNVEYEGDGTVFRMTTNGALTTLVSFNGANGAYPEAALIQGNDGSFYGTTYQGGAGYGTVFKMTTTGALTTVVSFGGTNGAYPQSGLVQATDGNYYGTTYAGGLYNEGTVFRLGPTSAPPPVLQSLAKAGNGVTLNWIAFPGQSYQVQYKTNLSQANWSNLGAPVTATNSAMSLSDPILPGAGQRFYRIVLLP